jgi:ADP-dependent NAD(P)H-hydrate dehydratase / NAD(P)H-hydrate epimerase
MKILTTAETREVDRLTTELFGAPGSLLLMENAGRSVAELLRARFANLGMSRFAVLCGKGNNGGDGFVAARHLCEMGAKPSVFLFAAPQEVQGDAKANLERLRDFVEVVSVIDEKAWQSVREEVLAARIFVDALLGTGVRGPVQGVLAAVVNDVNASEHLCVLGVDIPSGLNADTGAADGPVVRCDVTVTFTAPKRGFFFGHGAEFAGDIVVKRIGSPPRFIDEVGRGNLRWNESAEFAKFAAPRKPGGHKGDYGHALIVAGSVGKTGAAVLASWAALRAGAGLVTVATPEPALPIIAAHTPEVMTEPLAPTLAGTVSEKALEGNRLGKLLEGKRALAIGPGLSQNAETQSFIRRAVGEFHAQPVILDADGLNAFAGRAKDLRHDAQLLCVTPHPGEMARLVGASIKDVQARRVEIALQCAAEWNAVVVLKGEGTVVAAPGGSVYINSTGNPGMGTGGTGDVLTGILAGLAAQFARGATIEEFQRICAMGVYLHGLAGDIAYNEFNGAPLLASDLINKLPAAYQNFYAECGRG